jgi:hypothetical protein
MLRVLAASLCLVVLCLATDARAGAQTDLGYTRGQVYSGALRYLRIDLGYEITEKDEDAAYLLFRYVPQGTSEPTFGAIEIVQVPKGVKVSVKLPKLPSYHEAVIRNGLLLKLKADYGGEPEPKSPPRDESKPKDPPAEDRPKPPKSKEKRPAPEAGE